MSLNVQENSLNQTAPSAPYLEGDEGVEDFVGNIVVPSYQYSRGLDHFIIVLKSKDIDVSFTGNRWITLEETTYSIDQIAHRIFDKYQQQDDDSSFDPGQQKIRIAVQLLENAYQTSESVLTKKKFLFSSDLYIFIFQIFQSLREKIFGTVFPRDQVIKNNQSSSQGERSNPYWDMKAKLGIC